MTRFTSVDEWRAKKQFSEKIEVDGPNPEMRGFIYPDGAWIELEDSGQWHTIVGNAEEFRWDLRSMEDYLWACHSFQHLSTPREVLTEDLHKYCERHGLPQFSADELQSHCEERRNTYQLHVEWLDQFLKKWEAAK